MQNRAILISAMVVSGILTLTSCGSSDSSESTNGDTEISKAEFVEQANARCTTLGETLSNAQADLGSGPTEEQISEFMTDVLVVAYRDTISDIRDLGFPAGDADRLNGILDDADNILDDIAEDPIGSLAQPESPFVEVNVGFQDYGLTVCAET